MGLYIYCPFQSQSAYELVQALGAKRLRKFDGMDFWRGAKRFALEQGDILICWGKPIPEIDGVRILNSGNPRTRAQDFIDLSNAGIYTIPCRKGANASYEILRSKTNGIIKDLLNPPSDPCYSTHKLNLVAEYRVHSFDGRSIRAGERVLRDGFVVAGSANEWMANLDLEKPEVLAHPWIKTWETGWRIQYDGFKSNQRLRKAAAAAVKHLDLTFGAVDVGLGGEDRYYVLKVDKAPVLDSGTVQSYSRAIQRWIREEKPEVEEEEEGAPVPLVSLDQDLGERLFSYGSIRGAIINESAPINRPPVVIRRGLGRAPSVINRGDIQRAPSVDDWMAMEFNQHAQVGFNIPVNYEVVPADQVHPPPPPMPRLPVPVAELNPDPDFYDPDPEDDE